MTIYGALSRSYPCNGNSESCCGYPRDRQAALLRGRSWADVCRIFKLSRGTAQRAALTFFLRGVNLVAAASDRLERTFFVPPHEPLILANACFMGRGETTSIPV